ncbi:MAG: hypothetical protein E7664_02885 [Ruminococcaceae bacterium]|nr:hypothetical protein [Oscillospiraceae bacterium]
MEERAEKKTGRGRLILIVLIGLVGMLLLLVGKTQARDSTEANAAPTPEEVPHDVEAYEQRVCEEIEELCASVTGAGSTHVVVTLGGGYSAVYAVNAQSSTSGYRSEYVMVGSGSSEQPLLVGYSVPTITGIGIVCEGGRDPEVCGRIISLVSAAYGVSSHKIFVTA